MLPILRVVFTITLDPIEFVGGVHTLENGTKLSLYGRGVTVLYDLANCLNNTMQASFAEYDEAVKMVASNISDIGGILMSQDIKWKDDGLGSSFVYLHPLDYASSYVYFRQPPSDAIRSTLVRPFNLNVWITLLSLMLLVSVIAKRNTINLKLSRLTKLVLFAFELLIDRHIVRFQVTQVPFSVTVLRLTVSFFGIVITSLYTAKIASIFVLRDNLIKTPTDLINYGYELNTYSWIHVNNIFEDPNVRDEAMQKFKYVKDLSTVLNVIKGKLNGLRQSLFAHPDGFYPQALYSLKHDEELCVVSMFQSTRKTPRSFYINKNSVFRERLNIKILVFIERGVNFRHKTVFKSKSQFNCYTKETDFQPLSMQQLEVAFVILGLGALLSLFSML